MISLKPFFKGKQGDILCFLLLLLSVSCLPLKVKAQKAVPDTLSVTLHQADKLFLEQNLELIAQHYNIESGKALVLQAKLWDDPTLTTDQNIYADNKWLEHGTNPDGSPKGQYFIQLEQLIKTAGKRRKLINMAQTNVQLSEWQFSQVMQNLKYELHDNFYQVSRLLAVQQVLQKQSEQLGQLQLAMSAQLKAGNIAQKDLLRVMALQLALKQEIAEAGTQLEDNMCSLKSLLGTGDNIFIRPLPGSAEKKTEVVIGLHNLIDSAQTNNAAFRLEQYQLQYQLQNAAYQRALAVPDITIAPSYDHNSNYAPHYFGLGISLPLPLYNRNKGNIKAAQLQVKQQETMVSQAAIRVSNQVTAAYNNYMRQAQLVSGKEEDFFSDYAKLYESIAENFRQRRISMLEFIDYFNDYKEVRLRQLQQELNLRLAEEELNLQTGTDIFNN